MRFETIVMTPQKAQEMLANNDNNRSISQQTVAAYARDMQQGDWEKGNPTPIVVSETTGQLKDGQHRLKAVILAGVNIEMVIAYVADDISVFDMQRKRSTKDWLNMNKGYCVNSAEISAARMLLTQHTRQQITNSNVLHVLEKYGDMIHYISNICNSRAQGLTRKTAFVVAMLSAYMAGEDVDKIRKFVYVVNTGLADGAQEFAAVQCRNWYNANVMALGRNTEARWDACGLIQEYFYQFTQGVYKKRPLKTPTHRYWKKWQGVK